MNPLRALQKLVGRGMHKVVLQGHFKRRHQLLRLVVFRSVRCLQSAEILKRFGGRKRGHLDVLESGREIHRLKIDSLTPYVTFRYILSIW